MNLHVRFAARLKRFWPWKEQRELVRLLGIGCIMGACTIRAIRLRHRVLLSFYFSWLFLLTPYEQSLWEHACCGSAFSDFLVPPTWVALCVRAVSERGTISNWKPFATVEGEHGRGNSISAGMSARLTYLVLVSCV